MVLFLQGTMFRSSRLERFFKAPIMSQIFRNLHLFVLFIAVATAATAATAAVALMSLVKIIFVSKR